MESDREFQYAILWLAEKAGYSVDDLLEGIEQVRARFEAPPEQPQNEPEAPSDMHAPAVAPVVDVDATPMRELPVTALPAEPTVVMLAEDTRVARYDYTRFTDAGGSVEARGKRFFVDDSIKKPKPREPEAPPSEPGAEN